MNMGYRNHFHAQFYNFTKYTLCNTTKFRDQAAATDYANAAGWHYLGPAGSFRKYHEYEGVNFVNSSWDTGQPRWDEYRLRVYSDGLTCLYICKQSGILGGPLPEFVYKSEKHYQWYQDSLNEADEICRGAGYHLEQKRHNSFEVKALEYNEELGGYNNIGRTVYKATSFTDAAEWAKKHQKTKEHAKKRISKKYNK